MGTSEHYTIRYRGNNRRGQTALIVEDSVGAAYLFSGGALQGRVRGGDASTRLRRMSPQASWRPVPRVAPYTLDGLRRITD